MEKKGGGRDRDRERKRRGRERRKKGTGRWVVPEESKTLSSQPLVLQMNKPARWNFI